MFEQVLILSKSIKLIKNNIELFSTMVLIYVLFNLVSIYVNVGVVLIYLMYIYTVKIGLAQAMKRDNNNVFPLIKKFKILSSIKENLTFVLGYFLSTLSVITIWGYVFFELWALFFNIFSSIKSYQLSGMDLLTQIIPHFLQHPMLIVLIILFVFLATLPMIMFHFILGKSLFGKKRFTTGLKLFKEYFNPQNYIALFSIQNSVLVFFWASSKLFAALAFILLASYSSLKTFDPTSILFFIIMSILVKGLLYLDVVFYHNVKKIIK